MGLERLELRIERLDLLFRFTYAFHAREIRFERDIGSGFQRIFPETFSFRADLHDPAEIHLQLDDLSRQPRLLHPEASRRDAELLVSRLVLAMPRYIERVLDRLEGEGRMEGPTLSRVYEDVALLAQVVLRFVTRREVEGQGLRIAVFHLRKLALRAFLALIERRVEPAALEAYARGEAEIVDPADDLSESGFFLTMESGSQEAVNRSLLRLAQRAFYRWLEDICLDEQNRAFEVEDSPFEDRETEVRRAIHRRGERRVVREGDLVPFLLRPGDRSVRRVLAKLERWFLRQYDIHHAAAMIQHADDLSRGRRDPDRVLSRHSARSYSTALLLLVAPFLGAIFFYERAPLLFDAAAAAELAAGIAGVGWFLGWRFLWKKDLTFFRASVPRIAAGIIVGYLPIFFIDEVWSLAQQALLVLAIVSLLLGATTLLYIYIEVQRRLPDSQLAFGRARSIFLLGVLQAFSIGLVVTGLVGGFMAVRNWGGMAGQGLEGLRGELPPLVGQLPMVIGVEPLYVFPSALFLMSFLSFFIGTFLQLMWEDLPITEPL